MYSKSTCDVVALVSTNVIKYSQRSAARCIWAWNDLLLIHHKNEAPKMNHKSVIALQLSRRDFSNILDVKGVESQHKTKTTTGEDKKDTKERESRDNMQGRHRYHEKCDRNP